MRGKRESLLLLLSAGFCLICLEVALRLFPLPLFRIADPSFFSAQSRFQFHPDLEYTLPHGTSQASTFLGDDCAQRTITIESNDDGLREKEFDAARLAEPVVVFIGDSFTEGYHVESDSTFSARVGTRMAGGTALNFGIHNYSAYNYLLMARWATHRLPVDMIIVGLYVGNDLWPYSRTSYRQTVPLDHLQHAVSSRLYLVRWLEYASGRAQQDDDPPTTDPVGGHSYFEDVSNCSAELTKPHVAGYRAQRLGPGSGHQYRDAWRLEKTVAATAMVLQNLQKAVAPIPMHVLVIPERLQLNDGEWDRLAGEQPSLYRDRFMPQQVLIPALREARIEHTNLLPALDSTCFLRFDGHLSSEGHRRVTDVALEVTQRTRSLPADQTTDSMP